MPNKPSRRRKKTVLAIDSNYDPVTGEAWRYRRQRVYPHLRRQGFRVTELFGPAATRKNVEQGLSNDSVGFVTGVGHGLRGAFSGHRGRYIFQTGVHAHELRDKMAHFLSCLTARKLGRQLVEGGCRAFFGYDNEVVFRPEYLEHLFACDASIDRGLADGLSADEAYNRVLRRVARRSRQLINDNKDQAAAQLRTAFKHLCAPSTDAAYGDPSARLS